MTSLSLRLLPGRVLLRRDAPETAIGRILLPDTARKVSRTALCVLHEPSTAWHDIDLTGHHVVYEEWSGKLSRLGNVVYYVVDESAILAILESTDHDQEVLPAGTEHSS